MSLNNIRIVLIETSHPGNIGSAARAMKTMGVSDLCLVSPKQFPDSKAHVMASGADSILEAATVVDTLQEALQDCTVVVGTSARFQRQVQWPQLTARECGEFAAQESETGKVAIVFGRESSGLTNDELQLCQYLVHIPVNPDFSSLNVASAVQVLSYEVAQGMQAFAQQPQVVKRVQDELVSADDMEGFYGHLEQALIDTRYLNPEKPKLLMRRLRSIYGRLHLTHSELNILRGILSACQGRKFESRKDREK